MARATIDLTAPSPLAPPITRDSLYSKWLQVLDPSKPVNIALRHISRETMLSIIQRLMIKDVNVEQAVTEMLITADKDVKEWDEAHERSYHSGESQEEEEEEEEEDEESESDEDEDGDGDESDEGRSRERKPIAGRKAPQKAKSQNNDPNPKKRQRICFAMCELCEEEFDVTLNGRSACRFHDGELETDWEEWPDHDEDTHGPIDTEENRKDYPERFTWSCCETAGDAEGCRIGMHKEDTSKRVKL